MVIGLLYCSLAFDGGCIGLYTLSCYFSAFFNEFIYLSKKKGFNRELVALGTFPLQTINLLSYNLTSLEFLEKNCHY